MPKSGFIPSLQFSDTSVRQITEGKIIIGESPEQTETTPEPTLTAAFMAPRLWFKEHLWTQKGNDDLL